MLRAVSDVSKLIESQSNQARIGCNRYLPKVSIDTEGTKWIPDTWVQVSIPISYELQFSAGFTVSNQHARDDQTQLRTTKSTQKHIKSVRNLDLVSFEQNPKDPPNPRPQNQTHQRNSSSNLEHTISTKKTSLQAWSHDSSNAWSSNQATRKR